MQYVGALIRAQISEILILANHLSPLNLPSGLFNPTPGPSPRASSPGPPHDSQLVSYYCILSTPNFLTINFGNNLLIQASNK